MTTFRELRLFFTGFRSVASNGPGPQSDYVLEADIDRLDRSIDRLGDIVAGLREDVKDQAERTRAFGERQAADFRSLLTMLHDSYAKLIDRQDTAFKVFSDRLDKLAERQDTTAKGFTDRLDKLVERQDTTAKGFTDRLDKLVERQDTTAKGFTDRLDKLVERQDTAAKSFADRIDRLVERQDSHFRWLAGLIVASGLSIGIAVIKLH